MTAGTDRYGAVHSPLFASVLLVTSPPKLPDDVTLTQFFPPGGGLFRPYNFPNVFLGEPSGAFCSKISVRCLQPKQHTVPGQLMPRRCEHGCWHPKRRLYIANEPGVGVAEDGGPSTQVYWGANVAADQGAHDRDHSEPCGAACAP